MRNYVHQKQVPRLLRQTILLQFQYGLHERNTFNLHLGSKGQLVHGNTSPALYFVSHREEGKHGKSIAASDRQTHRLTGLGLMLPKNSSYTWFIGAKSSIVVRKTLTLTALFKLLPAASRTAERFLIATRWDTMFSRAFVHGAMRYNKTG